MCFIEYLRFTGIGHVLGQRFRQNNITTANGLRRRALRLGKEPFLDWMKHKVQVNGYAANKIFKELGVQPDWQLNTKVGPILDNTNDDALSLMSHGSYSTNVTNEGTSDNELDEVNCSEKTVVEATNTSKRRAEKSPDVSNSKNDIRASNETKHNEKPTQESGKELMKLLASRLRKTKVRKSSSYQ